MTEVPFPEPQPGTDPGSLAGMSANAKLVIQSILTAKQTGKNYNSRAIAERYSLRPSYVRRIYWEWTHGKFRAPKGSVPVYAKAGDIRGEFIADSEILYRLNKIVRDEFSEAVAGYATAEPSMRAALKARVYELLGNIEQIRRVRTMTDAAFGVRLEAMARLKAGDGKPNGPRKFKVPRVPKEPDEEPVVTPGKEADRRLATAQAEESLVETMLNGS